MAGQTALRRPVSRYPMAGHTVEAFSLLVALGGGDGGASVAALGGLDVPVDSDAGVDGSVLAGAVVVEGVSLGVAEVRLGCGDGLTRRASRIGWSWPRSVGWRTIVGLSVVTPAPPPSSGAGWDVRGELTTAGEPLAGTATMVANWAPSHIAGPRPTETMAPKSANGPRSIARATPCKSDDPRSLGRPLPNFRYAKRTSPEHIVTRSQQRVTVFVGVMTACISPSRPSASGGRRSPEPSSAARARRACAGTTPSSGRCAVTSRSRRSRAVSGTS